VITRLHIKVKSWTVNTSVISFVNFTALMSSLLYVLSVSMCWNACEMVSERILSWPHFKFRFVISVEVVKKSLSEFEPVRAQSECSTLLFYYEFSAIINSPLIA
jgi:hypothetical protein